MSGQGLTRDAWEFLKQHTSARIAIGRCGGSLPTAEWLDFKLAHARAKDAVYRHFDAEALALKIQALGHETLWVGTQAKNRMTYLQRPDLGRQLDHESGAMLKGLGVHTLDLAIIVSDGLSALAVERQTVGLLQCLLPRLRARNFDLAPIVLAPFARVALEDEIGVLLKARIALILLGERPGLGSPDSLGAYLVYAPARGRTDAERNCVSNIRPEGLSYQAAAGTLDYLLNQARIRKLSGVQLKDDRSLIEQAFPEQDPMATLPAKD